ncbi:MAG: class I SAM-dependent methyltransferase [Bacteroidales bacterium]
MKYLPFHNEAFSLILSLGVLEHFEDLKDIDIALKEAYRCLKPGGHLLVTVPYLSWNRQFNPQVVARRLASRINWLRKIFNKGEKLFFQYEFSKKYFRNKLLLNNFSIIYEELIWLDLGLKDVFRGLYPLLKRIIYAYHHISYLYLKNIIKKLFAAFMLFLCIKQQST